MIELSGVVLSCAQCGSKRRASIKESMLPAAALRREGTQTYMKLPHFIQELRIVLPEHDCLKESTCDTP